MPIPSKSLFAACAIALAVTAAAAPSPAAAEMLPDACYSGATFIHNGIPYANRCVARGIGYDRNRCKRWIPVRCGGGGTGNR
jgi:hypothetical protein